MFWFSMKSIILFLAVSKIFDIYLFLSKILVYLCFVDKDSLTLNKTNKKRENYYRCVVNVLYAKKDVLSLFKSTKDIQL